MFLDESGIATDLIRRYGRSRRGTRLPDQAPHGRWQSHTFVAAVRLEGITAPGVIDGPIDGVSFLAYVEQILVPTLRPGDRVILENLTVHHDAAIRIVIEQTGATLRFLPPYSPDFNPIELCFAKLKAVLRAARPRAFDAICRVIAECLPRFSADECAAYFRHCGYSAATHL